MAETGTVHEDTALPTPTEETPTKQEETLSQWEIRVLQESVGAVATNLLIYTTNRFALSEKEEAEMWRLRLEWKQLSQMLMRRGQKRFRNEWPERWDAEFKARGLE